MSTMRRRRLTRRTSSAWLVQFHLDRIAAYDQAGPHVNAVLYVNPRAVADGRALDAERRRHGPRDPLHGIPVLPRTITKRKT
jgi:amidase